MTGTYEGEIKDLVAIEITNSASGSIRACYINSSDYESYNVETISSDEDATIYAIRNTIVAFISLSSEARSYSDWNNELEEVYSGRNSAAYYIPTTANNSSHIVIT